MQQNDYLSDEENNENELIEVELDMYGMPIENEFDDEEDEEEIAYRRILNEKLLSKSNNYEINKENSISKESTHKTKQKKSLSLKDFNNLIDSRIEAAKPKKFVSKRILEKKQMSDTPTIKQPIATIKRQFNPKFGFVPYLLSDQYKNRRIEKSF
jgi:hypothetical protein